MNCYFNSLLARGIDYNKNITEIGFLYGFNKTLVYTVFSWLQGLFWKQAEENIIIYIGYYWFVYVILLEQTKRY